MDLNLLLALDALIEHQSVQGAANAMKVTPPAMSHTLRRLRVATGDDVLVRNGRRMIPTPRALDIREDVRDLVVRAQQVLAPPSHLDLPLLERSFTIRGNEALLSALAAPLLADIAGAAPGVTLVLLGEQPVDDHDLVRGLADIALGGVHDVGPTIRSQVLGEDHLDVVMRAHHPLAARDRLDLEAFANATHVVASRRGRRHGPIDDALSSLGYRRTISATLPTSAMAFDVVQRSDAITVAAGHLVPVTDALVRRPLPLDLPALTAVMTWHRRHDTDPAHRWLRSRIGRVFSTRFPPAAPPAS